MEVAIYGWNFQGYELWIWWTFVCKPFVLLYFHFHSHIMILSKTINSFTVTSTEFTGPLTIGAGCISCNDDTWCNSKLHTWNSTSPSKFRVVRQYYNFLTRPSWPLFCTENIVDCCMPLTIFITQELGWPSPLWYSFGFFYNF